MSWKPEFIILLVFSTLVDYVSCRIISTSNSNAKRKIFLFLSLLSNLGLLFTFKYFEFFSDSVIQFLNSISIPMQPLTISILLPVGISFYTFQSLSYTIDVYRGKIPAEKHLGIFAVYVSFFPQLVAGPIERAKNLLPQFRIVQQFDYARVTNGLKLILWGFFKKIVIADSVAVGVDFVYNNPTENSGLTLIVATILFAFQIYCDFSGYSDIAIGSSQILGISLMDNFKRPYFSRSIAEFWRRWHISLSTWFKDYLYIPLGGNRMGAFRNSLNIIIVFVVSGLWHGANWTFFIWGLLHGLFLVFGRLTQKIRNSVYDFLKINKFSRIKTLLQIIFTFFLVSITWIFFRANTLSDAIYIVKNFFKNVEFSGLELGMGKYGLLISISAIVLMELIHLIQEHYGMRKFLSTKPFLVRWSAYALIIISILFFGSFDSHEFIYFQF